METPHVGYHKDCEKCKEYRLLEVDKLIFRIKQQMANPHTQPMTSNQMKHRADRLRDIRASILITGGEVKDEYK